MLKRACAALAAFFVLSAGAHAAGTVPGFSLTPQFDQSGKVALGCKLYVIQAGTTSAPQNVYQDTGLTTLRPNPMTCDASGRLPQWFVADGLIKLRLTDKNGVQIFPLTGDSGDNLLVIGPSSGGGGGGGTIDPTTIATTGDVKASYTSSVIVGWVRMNGRTIGSATSGATERANADTQSLFNYLWTADANLAVSGGRGASAAADWAANKTIALPDAEGRTIAGLDVMGGADNCRLCNSLLATSRNTLGGVGGEAVHTLAASEIPTITALNNNTFTVTSGSNRSDIVVGGVPTNTGVAAGGNTIQVFPAGTAGQAAITSTGTVNPNTIGTTSINTGGGAHNNMQPTILMTFFIKL
jgi:microcystin-dependent protein